MSSRHHQQRAQIGNMEMTCDIRPSSSSTVQGNRFVFSNCGAQSPSQRNSATTEAKTLCARVKAKANQNLQASLEQQGIIAKQKFNSQRKQWQEKREIYKIYAYGSPNDRKRYQHQVRQDLLAQVKSKEEKLKNERRERVKEAVEAMKTDYRDNKSEIDSHRNHFLKLRSYCKFNQQLMEERRQASAIARQQILEYERNLLTKDPFNWSKTLS
eukprot:gene8106-766_t